MMQNVRTWITLAVSLVFIVILVARVSALDNGVGDGGSASAEVGGATVAEPEPEPEPIVVSGIADIDPVAHRDIATRLGVTEAALTGFLKRLEQEKVAPEDLDSRLRELAERYRELEQQLEFAFITPDDPEVVALMRAAREALEAGEFAHTEELIREGLRSAVALTPEVNTTWSAPFLVRSSRLFAGRGQYPPEGFAAYGIVAFTSAPTRDDRERYLLICEIYSATLPHTIDLPSVPRHEQMVTVWPVRSERDADVLNRNLSDKVSMCNVAVDEYDLVAARQAIKQAKEVGREESHGRGPYLLAWSPGQTKGARDALVLRVDLSHKSTHAEIRNVFVRWAHDIEQNPALWKNRKGWSMESAQVLVGEWADSGGEVWGFIRTAAGW